MTDDEILDSAAAQGFGFHRMRDDYADATDQPRGTRFYSREGITPEQFVKFVRAASVPASAAEAVPVAAWLKFDGMKAMPAYEKAAYARQKDWLSKEIVSEYSIPLYRQPPAPKEVGISASEAAPQPAVVEALRGLLEYCAERDPNQGDPATDDRRVTAAGAALASLPEPIPAGWKMVPKQMTGPMVDAWESCKPGLDIANSDPDFARQWIQAHWDAMLAAAPSTQGGGNA